MKKVTEVLFAVVFTLGIGVSATHAQMMRGVTITDDHTVREEAEGKAIWVKLQAKEAACDKLTDNDFDVLGEYFMGQMMGASHAAMNAMMTQTMGEQGEAQMHVAMGKRLSGCDMSAVLPMQGVGFMPMMQMMWGAGSRSPGQSMGFGPSHPWALGLVGVLFSILWLGLLAAGAVFLVKWVIKLSCRSGSAFDILKERYARGEINKTEFEEKKKDLT